MATIGIENVDSIVVVAVTGIVSVIVDVLITGTRTTDVLVFVNV